MNFFITTLSTNPTLFLLVVLSVIPSICLHEYFHAQTALWMGDDTAARQGHLTLNPLRQMGWLSLVMFLLIGIAWGMVPVDRSKLTRKGAILTTFAGPLTNLVLFFLSAAALCLMILLDRNGIVFPELLGLYFQILGLYNLVLFILNMLPIPGLDGWAILSEIFPVRHLDSEFINGAMLLLMLLLFVGIDYLFDLAGWVLARILQFAAG